MTTFITNHININYCQKQGIGSYTQNKGDCYVGLFSNDFYDGLGEIVYANGSTYEVSLIV
jgi:hypothetical protein